MNDFLRFMKEEPIHRKYHFNLMTFSLMYAFNEKYVLPFSHDEVVHGKGSLINKMPGDAWQKAANLRLALGAMWSHPGKKLLFMGIELGQWREWSENRSLDWHLLGEPLHAGMQRWMRDLNALYRGNPALWQNDFSHTGFEWIDFRDVEQTVLSYVRRTEDGEHELLFVLNFTPVPRHAYHLGVPRPGRWREVLNSDAEVYGGSNVGNMGVVQTVPLAAHGREQSLPVTLPPLGILVLRHEG
jgi:1,4-alpha-glucan branching enzyme